MSDYFDKYIKYKQKYIQLLNEQNMLEGGGNNEMSETKISKMNFEKGLDIYRNVIETSVKLEQTYEKFWKNINYNDAYVFYKNSIDYYKNVQNNKFHDFFSGIINKKLYTGSCQYIEKTGRTEFTNDDENIEKIDLDDLCELSVQVINTLDIVLYNCPKIPFNLNVYRAESREVNNEIFNLKKGDYYRNLGYMSTSISPWLLFSKEGDYFLRKNNKYIIMTILLPKKSSGYYMNSPFGIIYDNVLKKFIGYQEYEILLPRENIFEVLETKTIKNCFFIKLILRNQMIPANNRVEVKNKSVPPSILNSKEYNEIIKNKDLYFDIKSDKKDFIIDKNKINIYLEYLSINKNKKPITPVEAELVYEKIIPIDSKYLVDWTNTKTKPKYNPKKYPSIKEKEFDEVYNKFLDLLKNTKKTNKIYIIVSVLYKKNNHLYNQFTDDVEKGKIIKITKPIIFDTKITSSIFFEASTFICKTEGKNKDNINNYFTIDNKYPHFIIIEYHKNISYIPLNSGYGMTFGIEQLKIIKSEKINITEGVYYYLIEAK
jgi:hypothetical protein